MLRPRVIPCLLLTAGRLVKTTRFAAPVYVGDPINTVKIFNDKEVDELMVLDIAATRERRGPDLELLARVGREAFVPVAYGGGLRDAEMVRRVIGLGIEKVVLDSAALDTPELVTRAADLCGSQSVVACIDVKRDPAGRPRVWSHARGRPLDLVPADHAAALVAAGAGEVVVSDVDRDGTMQGYDLELIRGVTDRVDVPVVALGGAGAVEHLRDVVLQAGASAAAAGAMFVFHGKRRAVLISYPTSATMARLFA